MASGTNSGGSGPSEHNPFKDQTHAAETNDKTAEQNPTDVLTSQDQPKDAGPLVNERKIGESQARARPPLMEK